MLLEVKIQDLRGTRGFSCATGLPGNREQAPGIKQLLSQCLRAWLVVSVWFSFCGLVSSASTCRTFHV